MERFCRDPRSKRWNRWARWTRWATIICRAAIATNHGEVVKLGPQELLLVLKSEIWK